MEEDESKVCPITRMTTEEKEALQLSWKSMTGRTAKGFKDAGVNMLLWMFDHVPGVREQFSVSFPKSEKHGMIADEMFLAHVQSVMLALDALVTHIDNKNRFKKKMHFLARVHLQQGPPIGTEYFQPFADNYHHYVEYNLTLTPDSNAVKAWHKLFATMNEYIEQETIKRTSLCQAKEEEPYCCTVS